MNQNFNGYYLFYKVAETGSISKAGEILYISQPAVSKAVAKLEDQLNTLLFIRTPKGVELTQDGKRLYEKLKIAFTAIEEGEKELSERALSDGGKIRIGASASICRHLLLPYLEKFISEFPHMQVSISCQSSVDTVKLIESGQIDIGLVAKPEEHNGLEFIHVSDLEDTFAVSKNYLDTLDLKGNETTEEIISEANIMLLDEHNTSRKYIDEYLKENNITLRKITEVSGMDLLIDFAKIGMGISCVIKKFIRKELDSGKLTELRLNSPVKIREAVFAFRSCARSERCIKAFLSTLNDR